MIVQELCDEGLYDEGTIMRVLEKRASQLFPENYMQNDTSNSMVQVDEEDRNARFELFSSNQKQNTMVEDLDL